jgi:hypothetical protein
MKQPPIYNVGNCPKMTVRSPSVPRWEDTSVLTPVPAPVRRSTPRGRGKSARVGVGAGRKLPIHGSAGRTVY